MTSSSPVKNIQKVIDPFTTPSTPRKMTKASTPKAVQALALMSGCLQKGSFIFAETNFYFCRNQFSILQKVIFNLAERSFSFYRKEILILQKEVFNLAERSLNINLQKVLILKQRIFISRKGRFSILNFAEKNFKLAERKF